MKNALQQELADWVSSIVSFRIPRWEELPEIDLYMDQVIVFSERILSRFPGYYSSKLISPSIINNYVKLAIIPQPVKKKYSRTHIAYLMMICILKQVLPISAITDLINYQLRAASINDIYNRFCAIQEEATRSAVLLAQGEGLSSQPNEDVPDAIIENLVLKMAATANSSKILAEKIVKLERKKEFSNDDKPEEADDKKPKVKKQVES